MNCLGMRSPTDFSLRYQGVRHHLGEEQLELFGNPASTATAESSDGTKLYSEWFTPSGNACVYTYYLETGIYRLVSISTISSDASTEAGIHVGSTVAEVIAAYPASDMEFSAQTNCFTVNERILGGEGCRMEFYFETNGGFSEARADTLARTITTICVAVPTW